MTHTKYDDDFTIRDITKIIIMIAIVTVALVWLDGCEVAQGAELDIGLNYLSGQHASRSLNLGLKLPILNEAVLLSSRVRYGKHDDEIVQNQGVFRLSADPKIQDKWSAWLYEELGYDKPKGIDVENFVGGGLKYSFYEGYSFSGGYLYHYQEIGDLSEGINRLSFRLKGKRTLSKWGGPNIFGVMFYQPNIEDFDDYLASGEIGLSMAIVQNLGLKLSIEDHYRSMLDEPNEFLTSLSLVVEF